MDIQSKEYLQDEDTIDQISKEEDSDSKSEMLKEMGRDIATSVKSSNLNDVGDKVQMLGTAFDTEDEGFQFYNSYARSVGFSVRKQWKVKGKRDGIVRKSMFVCSCEGFKKNHPRGSPKKKRAARRTGCNARMAIQLEKDGKYIVREFEEQHNHELVPSNRVHLLRSHRNIKPTQAGLINNMSGIRSNEIFSYMCTEAGGSQNQNFIQSDCGNFVQRRHTEFLKKGDARLLLDYFKRMQSENKSFFYLIRVNDDNQITSCFWCDAGSRIDYSFFGDVVCFDTTYKTNGYDMTFAPIVGVNNHGQSIFFGCGLLQDETIESFIWLFETFIDAMGGRHPKAIFTDQSLSMANAITQVFPNTHHRLCLWHIYQNAMKQLSHVFDRFHSFALDFKSCIYDNETEEEYQLCWDALLGKYGLVGNEWLLALYQVREKWAQVYGRDHFCAGMTTTQRSESVNNYLKKYFKRSLGLREFVEQYDKAVSNQRDKEALEDDKSRQSRPNLFTKWKVEQRASEKFTRIFFNEFQKEILEVMDLDIKLDSDDGTMHTYKVLSYSGNKTCTVTYVPLGHTVKCSCKKFEFTGKLCAHALKLFRSLNMVDLPSQYYLKRWTIDAKAGVAFDACQESIKVDLVPSQSVRYNELSHIALTLAMKGARTKELASIAKCELMRVVEKLDSYLMAHPVQAEASKDVNSANHDDLGQESTANHSSANIAVQDPPHKKAKGQPSGRIDGVFEKARKRRKTQSQHTEVTGAGVEASAVSVRGIETPSGLLSMPLLSSGQAGPSSMPIMSYIHPFDCTQGLVRPVEHSTLHHVTDSTQSNQGFFVLLSQQASTQRELAPPVPHGLARRVDFPEPSASEPSSSHC